MLTVIESPEFQVSAASIWSEQDRWALIDWLFCHPDAGDLIPHSKGLRKLRWAAKGQGKRGGARDLLRAQCPWRAGADHGLCQGPH